MTATLTEAPSTASGKRRSQGGRVCRFIERYCVFTNGEWIGQPFRLLPWERQLLYELFEVGDDGLRRYTEALIGIPKKNGKTELIAALDLYFMLADGEPAPLVVCAASSDYQADLVFGAAKRMVELSPSLGQICQAFDKEIIARDLPGAKLERLAAVAGTNDGKNIHVASCDELHEWAGDKGRNVHTVLSKGMGARRQPLMLQITTAGYDLDTICGEKYEYGRKVEGGEVDDPRFFFRWWSAPREADWRDPTVWAMANPSYGITVREGYFVGQLKERESTFRRYNLNQWVAGQELWLPFGAWDACLSDLDLDPTLPVCVSIDVALRNDSTAVVIAQRQQVGPEHAPVIFAAHRQDDQAAIAEGVARYVVEPESEGDGPPETFWRTVIRARVWENPYPEDHTLHDSWQHNIFEVEEHLKAIRAQFPAAATEIDGEVKPGPEFTYDPAYFHRSAAVLEGEGLTMVEYPQHDSRMVPSSQNLYQLVVEGKLAHDGNSVLKRHVENAIADQKPRGWRLTKPKGSRKKIDAAVACAIASYRAQQDPPKPKRSVYESRGVMTA